MRETSGVCSGTGRTLLHTHAAVSREPSAAWVRARELSKAGVRETGRGFLPPSFTSYKGAVRRLPTMSQIDGARSSTPIVDAVDLRRRYGEGEAAVDALAGVTVDFPAGRFAAIMGPSGSGKSTLMHVLAGLDRPTGGTVRIGGVELTELKDRELTQLRRDSIGFVFQTFNLLPVLNAQENILLPLSIAGRQPDREWFDRLIDTVGIRDPL